MNHNDWKVLTEGGYASILINSKKEIMKVMPKYTEDNGRRCINNHALMELAVLCSYKGIVMGIPQITNYKIDEDSICIFMPFYGTPLNKCKIPKNKILQVATKLLEVLISLEANGIQHTDIKPCNILVSSDFTEVTLIDFNIVSFQLYIHTYPIWSKAYGTWNFCSPEIVLHTKPSSTSSVWSFGLILAYMYNRFPLTNYGKHDIKTLSSRTFWKNTMRDLHSKCPDGFLLPPEHVAVMPLDMVLLYQKCMRWQSKDRPHLQDVYAELTGSCYEGYQIKKVGSMITTNSALRRLYQMCKDTNTFCAFTVAATIYLQLHDVSSFQEDDMLKACHTIAMMLLDMFDVTQPSIEEIIWNLCSYKKWDILGTFPQLIFKDIREKMSKGYIT